MKNLLTLILFSISFHSYSQSRLDSALNLYKYNTEGKVQFEKIVESDLPKNERFKNAKKWIAVNYKDYNSVIKIEDEPNDLLIFKGISKYFIPNSSIEIKLQYTVEINIKDKKHRTRIYDIYEVGTSPYRTPSYYEIPFEKTLEDQKLRKDKKREFGAEPVLGEYNLFNSLITEISKAIDIKDDF